MRYLGASPTSFGEDRKKYVVGSGGVSAGDTAFNVSYDEGKVDAYLNGIRLFPDTDFTRTASGVGSNVTLASGVAAGDVLELFGLQGVHGGNGMVEDRFVVGTGSTGSGGSYTNSTTVFPVASNVGDSVAVWRNGVKLVHTTDFTIAPASSTVTLVSAATTSDEICVQVVGIVTSADFIPKAGGTFTGAVTGTDLTLTGNLSVTGTTTTIDTANTVIKDNLIGLNNGASSNANDSGLIIERGSTGNDALFIWDESADKFALGTTTDTAVSTGNLNLTTGTLVANIEGAVTGNVTGDVSGTAATVTGAAQTNITSVGTLTALTGGTGDFNWNSNTLVVDSSENRVGIGTASPKDTLHVYGTGGWEPQVVIENAGTHTTPAQLQFYKSRAGGVGVSGDYVGQITFQGDDDTSATDVSYATIWATMDDASASSKDGSIHFMTVVGNTDTEVLTITGGDIETSTTSKIKQKGAFMQSSTHQALALGY